MHYAMHNVDYAVAGCPSVCLFVSLSLTCQYCVETYHQTSFHQRIATSFYFFHTKYYGNIPTETPVTGVWNAGGMK